MPYVEAGVSVEGLQRQEEGGRRMMGGCWGCWPHMAPSAHLGQRQVVSEGQVRGAGVVAGGWSGALTTRRPH